MMQIMQEGACNLSKGEPFPPQSVVLSKTHTKKEILREFINYYQPMHYIAIKITQISFFYVIIRAPTCFDPPGSSSGSSECPY